MSLWRLDKRLLGMRDGFSDDSSEQAAYFTRAILVPAGVIVALHHVFRRFSGAPEWMLSDTLLLALLFWCIIGLILLKKGYVRATGRITVVVAWATAAANCWLGQGVHDPAVLMTAAAFIISGLIAGMWMTVLLATLTVLNVWLLVAFDRLGWSDFTPLTTWDSARDASAITIVMAITILLYGRGLRLSRERIMAELAERKRVEAQRQELLKCEQEARQKAEEAGLAKDRFMAKLSHELRTPLTPVVMSLSAMEEDTTLSPQLQHDARVMRQNLEIELRLINDLLDLSRVRFGKLALLRRPCRVNQLVLDVVGICRHEINLKKIQLTTDLVPSDPEISGDADRLRQVLWNLLRNATKFTPSGGSISIRTSVVDRENQPRVRIETTDSGCGIDADLMPRLFGMFEQGDAPANSRTGGLGVGLAICRAIIAEHHGEITATSTGRSQGSTFAVELPCALKCSPVTEAIDPHAGPLRILMVEDDTLTALTFDRILRILGHAPTHVESIAAVRETLASGAEFDLMISDIGLPDGSGLEAMALFAGACARPGIALSGHGTEQDIAASLKAGFMTHLVKPVTMPQLARAVNAAAAVGQTGGMAAPKAL